jgi:microcystin-dependent protein
MVGIILAVNYVIQFKRQLSSAWSQVNPKLKIGEPGFEIDTGRLKIGDGVTRWNSLPYQDTAVVDDISETLSRLSDVEDDVEEIQDIIPGIVPAGVISQFAGSAAPAGYLLCTGQELPISSYQNLYNVLGTIYGSLTNGSGSAGTTHFKLPNLQNRVPVAKGSGTFSTLGSVGGAELVQLNANHLPAHSHPNSLTGTTTFATSGHTHGRGNYAADIGATANSVITIGYEAGAARPGGQGPERSTYGVSGGNQANQAFNHYTPVYGDSGAASASASVGISNENNVTANNGHSNLQPYIVVNYIIKT